MEWKTLWECQWTSVCVTILLLLTNHCDNFNICFDSTCVSSKTEKAGCLFYSWEGIVCYLVSSEMFSFCDSYYVENKSLFPGNVVLIIQSSINQSPSSLSNQQQTLAPDVSSFCTNTLPRLVFPLPLDSLTLACFPDVHSDSHTSSQEHPWAFLLYSSLTALFAFHKCEITNINCCNLVTSYA